MFLVQLVQQGVVTPQQAIDALAAQVAAHRKLGQLALERRMLSAGDVMLILRVQSEEGGLFGAIAVELGLMTDEGVGELLRAQRSLIPPLDVVLVQRGILDRSDLVRWAMRNAYEPSKALSAQAD